MSNAQVEDADDLPVRRGDIYCSPGCGFGCTWASYQEACRRAEALARRLGDGWTTRVWENCKWHYRVTRGWITIHEYLGGMSGTGDDCYVASINVHGDGTICGGGHTMGTAPQWTSDFYPTPEEALLEVAQTMGNDMQALSKMWQDVRDTAQAFVTPAARRLAKPTMTLPEAAPRG